MKQYDPDVITDCVRDTFRSSSGQITLEWLRDLYVNHRSQALVQTANPNMATQLGYRLGQQDVVLFIEQVLEGAMSLKEQPEPESRKEEWYE